MKVVTNQTQITFAITRNEGPLTKKNTLAAISFEEEGILDLIERLKEGVEILRARKRRKLN